MVISETVIATVAKGVSLSAAVKLFGRLWKWGKDRGYEKARDACVQEMLKGDNCDWAVVESAIAQGRSRNDDSVDAVRVRRMYSVATKEGVRKKAAAKKPAAKKPAAKKTAAKKPAARKKATKRR